MGDWPLIADAGQKMHHRHGAGITPSSAHTKSSWVQVTAETLEDMNYLILQVYQHYYSRIRYLIDIGIGDAGNEVVIINNVCAGVADTSGNRQYATTLVVLPIHIPKGTRVVVRNQADITQYCNMHIHMYNSFLDMSSGLVGVDSFGHNLASTRGTSVDPGGTVDTYGSWIQFIAATDRYYQGIMIGVPFNVDSSRSTQKWTLQVGIGASGFEQVIFDEYPIACSAQEDDPRARMSPIIPLTIPMGSRVAIRLKCSSNTVDDRLIDVIFYGLY